MIVLSLFDGMSCGQIAFKELGIKVKYYASELDKHAIKQTQLNFPDTIKLGDVTKWREWDIDWSNIDILIGGSPCQGFSFAGKQLNFSDSRSKLFFVYVDILNHIKKVNPDVLFLLENVNMKKEYLRVISEYLGVFPVRINSNKVSAQNRDRWYWSNIRTKETGLFSELWTDIPEPEDRGILLNNILQPESEVDEKYYIKNTPNLKLLKNYAQYDVSGKGHKSQQDRCFYENGKHGALSAARADSKTGVIKLDKLGNIKPDQNKAGCLTGGGNSGGNHSDMDLLLYAIGDKIKIRRLTPIECSRLQTIPEWYKWECSDTQCYKMLGNGWTVEVIKHIFSFINVDY